MQQVAVKDSTEQNKQVNKVYDFPSRQMNTRQIVAEIKQTDRHTTVLCFIY